MLKSGSITGPGRFCRFTFDAETGAVPLPAPGRVIAPADVDLDNHVDLAVRTADGRDVFIPNAQIFNKVFASRFTVTGTWDDPVVEKVIVEGVEVEGEDAVRPGEHPRVVGHDEEGGVPELGPEEVHHAGARGPVQVRRGLVGEE